MCLSRSHSPRMLWHLKQTYVGYVNLFSSGRIGKRFWWIFNQFRFSLDGYWSKHHDFLWFLWFILWISFCPISFQRFLFILYFWTIELNTWSHWILLPHRPLSRTFFLANHISDQSHLRPISSHLIKNLQPVVVLLGRLWHRPDWHLWIRNNVNIFINQVNGDQSSQLSS